MRAFLILPAAGLGTRMATAAAKQYLELAGIPILVHAVRACAAAGTASIPIAAIYVAVRTVELERARSLLSGERFTPEVPLHVLSGGGTRQASVSTALQAMREPRSSLDTLEPDQPDDLLVVHDAVRPLATPALVERVIAAAAVHGAAIAGLPAIDTMKQVERTAGGAIITATLPRESVVHAQTPQAFRSSILRRAFAEAEADGFNGTDEASLVERAGGIVAVVQGSAANIKITQPGDLEMAEFLLARARRQVQRH